MENAEVSRAPLGDRRPLVIVLAVTTVYLFCELIGGYYANSLALISDAVHLLTDVAAICVGLLTLWISTRPAGGAKTYGYLRAEILGALFNGLLLWVLVVFIWFEAFQRLRHPPLVHGLPVMLIAAAGIAINSFSAWITWRGGAAGRTGMALRAIFLHVASDLAGSVGVLIAGAVTFFTDWRAADPVASILIGGLIVYSSWGLVREGVDILMESVPEHIDLAELHRDLLAVTGTTEVHDLHVWCLTSRQLALSAHAVVAPGSDQDRVLGEMAALLEHKFQIRHMTVQLERANRKPEEPDHF